jgi:signal peptidase I
MARTHRRKRWVKLRFHLGLLALFPAWTGTTLGLAPAAALLGGWRATTVVTGSMAPNVDVGDVILVGSADGDALASGRIVVFRNPAGPGLVTHRLVAQNPDGTWQTKGDANPKADSTPLSPDEVVGVARLVVPSAGLPMVWLRNGQAALAVIVAVVFGLACWASRFALLDRFDPWRPIRTSILVDGKWVMPVLEPPAHFLPRWPRRRHTQAAA